MRLNTLVMAERDMISRASHATASSIADESAGAGGRVASLVFSSHPLPAETYAHLLFGSLRSSALFPISQLFPKLEP